MATDWPGFLPAPQRAGFGLQPAQLTEQVGMAAGPARIYPRFTTGPVDVPTLSLKLTRGQYAMFKRFLARDLNRGTTPVAIPLDLGDYQGVVPRTGRILEPIRYDDSLSPVFVRASFRFQVLEDALMDADLYELIAATGSDPDDGDAAADSFNQQINYDIPEAVHGTG